MREPVGLALFLLAIAGCPSPPDISAETEQYGDLLASAHALACSCPMDQGHTSSIECDEDLGIVGADARACMADVLEGHEEAAKAFLDCANVAVRNYELCLEDNLAEGCVEGHYFLCSDAFDSELTECPALPVLDGFLACGSL